MSRVSPELSITEQQDILFDFEYHSPEEGPSQRHDRQQSSQSVRTVHKGSSPGSPFRLFHLEMSSDEASLHRDHLPIPRGISPADNRLDSAPGSDISSGPGPTDHQDANADGNSDQHPEENHLLDQLRKQLAELLRPSHRIVAYGGTPNDEIPNDIPMLYHDPPDRAQAPKPNRRRSHLWQPGEWLQG